MVTGVTRIGSVKRPGSGKQVTISGTKVFINGQGASVRPQDQAAFIRQQTGGIGGSAQRAIGVAESKIQQINQQELLMKSMKTSQEINQQQKIEENRRKRVVIAIQEKDKKLALAKNFIQRDLIERIGQEKVRKINQIAFILKSRVIPISKKKIGSKIKENTKRKLIKFFDNISGGSITERRLNKRDAKFNLAIEKFNKDFGGKELPEKEFKRAKNQERRLDSERKDIDREKEILANSWKTKIGRFLGTLEPFERLTAKEKQAQLKKIPGIRNRLKTLNNKIKNLERKRKKTPLDRIRLRGFKSEKLAQNREIERINLGRGRRVLMGELPLVPATGIPRGVTSIKFLGKQRVGKNGKVITDIIFKTSRGNVGIAKGVSVQKGSQGQSIVLGRFARKGVRFPSTKIKLGRPRSFISVEKIISKQKVIPLKKTISIIGRSKKSGQTLTIRKNIELLIQKGIGRSGVVKGRKLFRTSIRFPSGKIQVRKVKGISFDDFASLSAVIRKKDLSIIIGNTISRGGSKARFIGIIKGSSKVGRGSVFSVGQKQQYSKALQKLISASASAIAQAEQIKGISGVGVLASASNILSKSTSIRKIIGPRRVGKRTQAKQITRKIPTQKIINKQTQQIKTIQRRVAGVKTAKAKQIRKQLQKVKVLQIQQTKQKQRTKQLQKQLTKSITKQRTKQLQTQIQKQRQKVTQIQKQIQVQLSRLTTTFPSLGRIPSKFPLPIIIPTIKTKGFKRKTLKKSQLVFFIKIKKRGKIKSLSPRPLTFRDARDFLAWEMDNTLIRSAWFEPIGRSKNVLLLPKKMRGYFNKIKKKLRPFKIRLGGKRKIRKGYIEKKKFIGDTKTEIKQLQRLRRKSVKRNKRRIKKKSGRKRKVIRRRPVKKKKIRKRKVIKRKRKIVKKKKKRR